MRRDVAFFHGVWWRQLVICDAVGEKQAGNLKLVDGQMFFLKLPLCGLLISLVALTLPFAFSRNVVVGPALVIATTGQLVGDGPATAPAMNGATRPTTVAISDSGFETPDVGSGVGAYAYAPADTGWTFTAENPGLRGTGVTCNESLFDLAGATNGNSDGVKSTAGQAAFIQEGDGTIGKETSATISRRLELQAGTYVLKFDTEGRNRPGSTNPLSVAVYDQSLSTSVLNEDFTPATITMFEAKMYTFSVPTAGSYYLYFVGHGVGSNDVTSFIDNVSIEPAPVTTAATAPVK